MFVVLVNYKKPLEEIDQALGDHVAFLDKYYAAKKMLVSGRREPRIGGIILLNSNSQAEAEAIMREDPFYQRGLADYEFLPFRPTKFDPVLGGLIQM